jgi:hypothetical protein
MPHALTDTALPLSIAQHGILFQRREGDTSTHVPHRVTTLVRAATPGAMGAVGRPISPCLSWHGSYGIRTLRGRRSAAGTGPACAWRGSCITPSHGRSVPRLTTGRCRCPWRRSPPGSRPPDRSLRLGQAPRKRAHDAGGHPEGITGTAPVLLSSYPACALPRLGPGARAAAPRTHRGRLQRTPLPGTPLPRGPPLSRALPLVPLRIPMALPPTKKGQESWGLLAPPADSGWKVTMRSCRPGSADPRSW